MYFYFLLLLCLRQQLLIEKIMYEEFFNLFLKRQITDIGYS